MVTNEILANQISVALAGEALEMLAKSPPPVQLYIIKLSWAYYCRRNNLINQFDQNTFSSLTDKPVPDIWLGQNRPSPDLGNNDRLPNLQREFENPQLKREQIDWKYEVPATIERYGDQINFNHINTNQNTNLGPNLARPYTSIFTGESDEFNFTDEDFTAGSPADSAEY